MDINAKSQSSLSSKLNHPDQVAIQEDVGNSSSIIVGSTPPGCLMTSDNIHGSDGDDTDDVVDDDYYNDDDDDDYNDLYDDNDYDNMLDNNSDDENIKKNKQEGSHDDDYLNIQFQFDNADLPPGVEVSISDPDIINTEASAARRRTIPANVQKQLSVVQKYLTFKRFDSVDNFSDHRYLGMLHEIKPILNWTKKIHDEWNILKNNLPDTIYVRVCEERMDLLRAVIIGPTGTPYHDGLFVFDVHFPSNYPSVPPNVMYHSGGLRINPNLYKSGKVCLSLLNTWEGRSNEKWLPNKSTILQVLVSIQALILNAQPFFNEPGYDRRYLGEEGARKSKEYNEDTLILSLKTMIYTLRTPPQHFEDFVSGHYRVWGRVILIACTAYMEGAVVGSDVKGNFKDLGKVKTSQLQGFKRNVATMLNMLVESFTRNGSTDCEEFCLAD
ncbi:Ubiquitin-conjugating enzyme 25 [Heracleum sosnowskyi]|uniref:E2 ubiquitin-conjugating enzyme n=1 Tax=Heracleum sosnowskyi TaxID=360622 RepID=A0AAD8HNJ5_9APIA|nr:Ubiquitin-conjugating enzyme 25 [Heracleum sosnowskyi]